MLLKQKARKKPIVNHVSVIINNVYVIVNHDNWCNHKGLRILISNHGAQRPDQEFGIHHRPLFELAALTGFLTRLDQSVHKVKVKVPVEEDRSGSGHQSAQSIIISRHHAL